METLSLQWISGSTDLRFSVDGYTEMKKGREHILNRICPLPSRCPDVRKTLPDR